MPPSRTQASHLRYVHQGISALPEDAPPPDQPLSEEFLRLLAAEQLRLQGFIRSLVFDRTAAADVFQETCLAMWRNFGSFDHSRPFHPWALGIAKNQVLKYYRKDHVDRHVFSDELVGTLVGSAMQVTTENDARLAALEGCIEKLAPRHRELVRLFYREHCSAATIAERWQRSIHTVYKSLKQVRRTLMECVEIKMRTES